MTSHRALIAGLLAILGGVPLLLYGSFVGGAPAVSVVETPLWEQWAAVMAAFAIKPLYMVLSLLLISVLWPRQSHDLTALRWALIAFLAGEAACAANYLFFWEDSVLAEYLHSFGMAASLGLVALALMEAMDFRILRLSDPGGKCALLGLCRGCFKHGETPCRLRQILLFACPMLAVLALMPLTASPVPVSYNTTILGTLYNYSHAIAHQIYEIRYCPLVAMGLFAACFLVLLSCPGHVSASARVLLALGLGHLGFSFLRLSLLSLYREDLVWFVFWEEATELIFVLGIGFVLWTFRRSLLPTAKPVSTAQEATEMSLTPS